MGSWIEIMVRCGETLEPSVVPYVGTWIEIPEADLPAPCDAVVPYVGTWIEMSIMVTGVFSSLSFPTWERG